MTALAVPRRRLSPLQLELHGRFNHAMVALLAVVTVLVLVAPWIAPYDPVQPVGGLNLPPLSPGHLLGTDGVGRDALSRTLFGIRTSWLSALLVVIIGLLVGGAVGLVAGATGRWVDGILMRVTDLFLSLPGTLVAIAIVAARGPGLANTLIAISIVWWPYYARVVRGEVRALAVRPHVEAARLAGAGRIRVLLRHLLPGVLPTSVVAASLDIGNAVLLLAGLSFLGLGQREPAPELGSDTAAALPQLLGEWWVPVIPAATALLLSLAANLGGDALGKILGEKS
ncbi:binding-protein-dependent transport system inner membrane protein [Mycolicibacterium canariasense]|uniref:Binding-protein-dependent transport system inner membrane protein n=1 Tax=Mycolicibacterium canariasense TaxID=228230 RepID=A0A117I985_MYCCR|nr:ABC transporter permease [Mycolicibacterium canariasense]MCV7208870.1 ABC transporter permease [Mycolicibacterium canariasense]ORV07071.1 ABC transporter permease [Mycolicibacterium canariasense]GAS94340.1 binding-protein-dependent transport system inner membrane protein [Mycolicibacterium canariasense]